MNIDTERKSFWWRMHIVVCNDSYDRIYDRVLVPVLVGWTLDDAVIPIDGDGTPGIVQVFERVNR